MQPTRVHSQLLLLGLLFCLLFCLPGPTLLAKESQAISTSKPGATVEQPTTTKGITNYRRYSATFASAGQPTAAQLAQQQASGVERIIYIAFSDHKGSLAGEDRIVRQLGMDYLHIPVVWDAPTAGDFALFAAAMNTAPEQNTLLHCQVNFRASAFAMLYRVIHQNVTVAQAKQDMNSVWTPDANWTAFIRNTLEAHGISSKCSGCDWTPAVY